MSENEKLAKALDTASDAPETESPHARRLREEEEGWKRARAQEEQIRLNTLKNQEQVLALNETNERRALEHLNIERERLQTFREDVRIRASMLTIMRQEVSALERIAGALEAGVAAKVKPTKKKRAVQKGVR